MGHPGPSSNPFDSMVNGGPSGMSFEDDDSKDDDKTIR